MKELTAMPSSMFTDLEFQASNRINEVRNKLNKDANRLRHEQQAEFENALHQANQAKMEKEKSLEVTFGELVRLKQSLQAVEEQLRTKDSTINRLEQERGENETMLKKVQQSLRETENVSKEIETIKDRLVAEIKASQIKSDEINKLNTGQATSTSKIETLEQSLVQAKANAIEYQEKMRQLREYFNSELLEKQSSSKEELRQAQGQIIATENAKRELESSLDHSRKRAEAQIREIQDRSNCEKEDLQRQFAKAEAAEKRLESEIEKIRTDAENAIKHQQERNRSDLGEIQRRLNESQALSDEAEATIKRINSDNEVVLQKQIASEKKCTDLEKRALQAESRLQSLKNDLRIHLNQESMQHFEQQASSQMGSESSQNVQSPRAIAKADPFKKPRKKVDRQSNSVASMGITYQDQTDPSRVRTDKYQHTQTPEVKEFNETSDDNPGLRENDLGVYERLDEYGVSAIQPLASLNEAIREPLLKSRPMMSFSQFNQSLGRASTPQHKRSSSTLSNLETVSIPEEYEIGSTPTHVPDLASTRGVQKPPIGSRTPSKVPLKPAYELRGDQNTFGSLPSVDNPFFANIDRPKSQANTASRMAPSMHHSGSTFRASGFGSSQPLAYHSQRSPSVPNGAEPQKFETCDRNPVSRLHLSLQKETTVPLNNMSSPDYIYGGLSGFHRVTTYRHSSSRPPSGTSQHAEPSIAKSTPGSSSIKRRSSTNQDEGALEYKKAREKYSQAVEGSRGRITKSTITETQSQEFRLKPDESQSVSIKASQSKPRELPIEASRPQTQSLSNIPSSSQSRIRSSTQVSRVSSGGGGKPKKPTKSKHQPCRNPICY